MLFQLTDPLGDISARADISSRKPRQFGSSGRVSKRLISGFPIGIVSKYRSGSGTDLAPGSCQKKCARVSAVIAPISNSKSILKGNIDMNEGTQQIAQKKGVPQTEKTYVAKAYAAQGSTSKMAPLTIRRRAPRPQDVQIDILYCGVCHSDLHQVRNQWQNAMPTTYPCVPGHEIVGRVVKTGSAVKKFKEGDIAAVGCMVDSCRTCASCRAGEEQYCDYFPTLTYNGEDKHLGGVTYGGYSDSIVVDEAFVLRVSDKLNLAGAAPLLCAGITTYSPLRHWKVGKGQKVGVVGLGGLGHMGVKFAKAFGAHVVLFTTSPNKTADAQRLGAHEVVISKNPAEMQKHIEEFRLHPGYGFGRARFERLHRAAETGRNPNFGWRAGTTTTRGCLRSSFQAAPACRVQHRRHPRDAGDARFLRRARHHRRRRTDPD